MRNQGLFSGCLSVCLFLSAGAAAGTTYDFDYRIAGDAEARPAQVFDDGAKTYFQFAPGQPVPVILALGPAGERMAQWNPEGPYTVVQGVNVDWRLRLGRALAAVRHAGTRAPAGGVLYGAAVPVAEMGVAALPGEVVALGKPAVVPVVPSPPAEPLPEFTGAFEVHEQAAPAAHTSDGGMQGLRLSLKISMRRVSSAVTSRHTTAYVHRAMEPLPIRFRGNGLSPNPVDMAHLAERVREVTGGVEIYAYSGASGLAERQRWALRRGERVKAALVQAGLDPRHIRVVPSQVASVPLALVGFVAGVRV